jgi:hypothetical protein
LDDPWRLRNAAGMAECVIEIDQQSGRVVVTACRRLGRADRYRAGCLLSPPGKAKAITATARKIAVLFYDTLRHGISHADPGATYYEERYRQQNLFLPQKGYRLNQRNSTEARIGSKGPKEPAIPGILTASPNAMLRTCRASRSVRLGDDRAARLPRIAASNKSPPAVISADS